MEDKKENLRCVIEDLSNNTEYAKIEAIKEFAENLKNKIANLKATSPNETYQMAMQDMIDYYVPKIIDNLVKEMTKEADNETVRNS